MYFVLCRFNGREERVTIEDGEEEEEDLRLIPDLFRWGAAARTEEA